MHATTFILTLDPLFNGISQVITIAHPWEVSYGALHGLSLTIKPLLYEVQ